MQKGDTIAGTVGGTSKEPKLSKKGQPFTGVKVDGQWYQVWGDYTGLHYGQEVEFEVSWVAPDGGVVFCTMHDGDGKQPSSNGRPAQHPEPRSIEDRIAALEELVRKHEVQLKAMSSFDVPDDLPF